MMTRLIALCCSVVLLLSVSTVQAQKYGHLNSGNLLESLPKVKTANDKLEGYQKAKLEEIQTKSKALEAKYKAYSEQAQGGDLSPVQIRKYEEEIQAGQQELAKLEQDASVEIQKMRQEMLDPILKEVDEAIKAVGKANGYTLIFDTSLPNAILFIKETDDVTALVKKQLGVQ